MGECMKTHFGFLFSVSWCIGPNGSISWFVFSSSFECSRGKSKTFQFWWKFCHPWFSFDWFDTILETWNKIRSTHLFLITYNQCFQENTAKLNKNVHTKKPSKTLKNKHKPQFKLTSSWPRSFSFILRDRCSISALMLDSTGPLEGIGPITTSSSSLLSVASLTTWNQKTNAINLIRKYCMLVEIILLSI